jgi:CubicO group peptidase (beta-lactamase class C family)
MNSRIQYLPGIAAVVAGIAGSVTLPAQQRSTISRAEFTARADSLVNAYLASSVAPSAAVAVIRGSDTLVFKGYGLADMAASRSATPTTIYEIGSITKQFTSSAIMRLVEAGRINLDDDLSKYVPQFPLRGQRVSIRQLLTHTSGIHNYTLSPEWRKQWAEDVTPDAIVAFVAKDTLDFGPGTAYRYSNTNYVLLGMVIEKVTGQRYADHVDAVFFKPLGMRHTSYCPSKTSDPSFATGYSRSPDRKVIPMTYVSLTQPFSAGGLCSTVGDLVMWQRALASGKVVSPASFTLMTTAATLNNGSPIRYGFGLTPGNTLGHATVSHGGGINGFAAASLFVPADSLNIAVFTNIDAEPADPLASNLLRVAYGAAPVAPRPPSASAPQALPDAARDVIVGTYMLQLPGGGRSPIKFFVDGARMMAQREGQPANALTYLGNFQFGLAADPSLRVTFFRDGAGIMGKVTLLQGGVTMEGVRAP